MHYILFPKIFSEVKGIGKVDFFSLSSALITCKSKEFRCKRFLFPIWRSNNAMNILKTNLNSLQSLFENI